MRPTLVVIVGLTLAAAGASAAPSLPRATSAPNGATFVLTGRGWGHGVGMSQCGAVGYARRGWAYGRILRHYYAGTQIGEAPLVRVRVLVGDRRTSVRVSSRTAFKLRDGTGRTHALRAGTYDLTTALKVKLEPDKPARSLRGPLTFVPGRAALVLDKAYRGQLVVRLSGGRLRVINSVPLEQYLYGVVPLEIGSSAPVEALKAQAVAARSYALATRGEGDFDLYPDTRSQVYGGVGAEKSATNAAVDATAGRVLSYKGRVIAAYYFASSGGRTAAAEDAWPGSRPVPYLVSVPDPYDSVCSVHSWGPYMYSGGRLARRLGLSARVLDARTVVNPSQRVDALVLRTAAGRSSLSGPAVRKTLGLRSTWFRMGVLSLAPPATPAVFGVGTELTGVARDIRNVYIDQRVPGRTWRRLMRVRPKADGTFATRVKPTQTLDYRLVGANVTGGVVRVPVAPRVELELGALDELVGRVRPGFARARVDVQRQAAGRWRTVASTRTAADGSFVASLRLVPGSYRARTRARHGYVPGTSPALRVTG